MTSEQYNPLDKINLGKSVAEALLDQPDYPLSAVPSFEGAGIYAIYYLGDFPPYRPISQANLDELRWPIYIGKAIPSGSRRGAALSSVTKGKWLARRLEEHKESIASVEKSAPENIKVDEFRVKFLIVDDIWIPLGESLLIANFKPLWNRVLDGFGNHDPGAGRYQGLRPIWDTLHPGRGWALKCQPRSESAENVERKVSDFLVEVPAPQSAHINFDK